MNVDQFTIDVMRMLTVWIKRGPTNVIVQGDFTEMAKLVMVGY